LLVLVFVGDVHFVVLLGAPGHTFTGAPRSDVQREQGIHFEVREVVLVANEEYEVRDILCTTIRVSGGAVVALHLECMHDFWDNAGVSVHLFCNRNVRFYSLQCSKSTIYVLRGSNMHARNQQTFKWNGKEVRETCVEPFRC
jgi:hypothetical protein